MVSNAVKTFPSSDSIQKPHLDVAHIVKWSLFIVAVLAALYLVTIMYWAGQALLAFVCLCGFALACFVYLSKRAYAYRYMFPGLAGMAIFVVFPMVYTIAIGFTNYSSPNHLQTLERATQVLLDQTYTPPGGTSYAFSLHRADEGLQLVLQPQGSDKRFITPSIDVNDLATSGEIVSVNAEPLLTEPGEPLAIRDIIQLRDSLDAISVQFPDGSSATRQGLREFTSRQPLYVRNPNGTLTNQQTDEILTPNFETGFYQTSDGQNIRPGFRTGVGFANFIRTFTDPAFQGPFVQIFVWTVMFAGLTVLFTLIVGLTLACLLEWESLRFRKVYQTLLFLPYAVPAFISILVFRGLFNNNFGEINRILDAVLGIQPDWFSDPWLAKGMILIVNTWLGYPYIMVLCMGLIKSIPGDLYEASAIAGIGPWQNFTRITAPLLVRPLIPLLIASFAFNFNNFVLIALLTGGRPDIVGARVPAGTTDILVSYTYRIAFEDSGRNFGLAAAISTLIFVLVAIMAIVQIRVTKANESAA
jgi:maltose/maltodextrin transport system permease protein